MTHLSLTPQQTHSIQGLLPDILKLCHWTSRSTHAHRVFGLDTETRTLHLSGASISLGFLIPQMDRETQKSLYALLETPSHARPPGGLDAHLTEFAGAITGSLQAKCALQRHVMEGVFFSDGTDPVHKTASFLQPLLYTSGTHAILHMHMQSCPVPNTLIQTCDLTQTPEETVQRIFSTTLKAYKDLADRGIRETWQQDPQRSEEELHEDLQENEQQLAFMLEELPKRITLNQ